MDAGRLPGDQQFESGVLQQRVCEPALAAFISAQRKRDQCVRLSLAVGFAMRTGRCSPAWTAAISTVSALTRPATPTPD
jgi:hypothetical protein